MALFTKNSFKIFKISPLLIRVLPPPSSSYEAQRKAISDFGWLERFRAMFTVTDETDMQKNTPFKIAPLLLP